MAKKVAETLKDLPTSDVLARVLDPEDDIADIVAELKKHWAYNLYTRSPGPALLERGIMTTRDLDLACFLAALVERKAVINLPVYESRRQSVKREGEYTVSSENRHGSIMGLTANQDVFSFSVRMNDMNVITSGETNGTGTDQVGAPRNFMLVDLDGRWYPGWQKIVFLPSAKENAWLREKELMTWNKSLSFEHFIHPNRWTSLYGQWYVLTKIVIDRLKAEASYLRKEVKKITDSGKATFPKTGPGALREWAKTEAVGESESIQVPFFEAIVDGVPISEAYPVVPATTEGLVAAKARINAIQYYDVPALSFAVRATEMAFANKAKSFSIFPRDSKGRIDETKPVGELPQEPFPAWVSGATWERNHKVKRTMWNRLVLHQHVPFAKGLAIRYRVDTKAERVRPEID